MATGYRVFLDAMKSKLFWWMLIIAWCGLIYFMSSINSDASSNQSLFVARLLNRLIEQVLGPHAFAVTETAVRKTAHFFEYYVLGSLLFMGFCDRARIARTVLLVFLAGIFFALSDELHQSFVPGRTMRFVDCLIDTMGVGTAVCVLLLTGKRASARRKDK
jgi:VanZ family protein